ncbi:PREDICTED: uncharacterized protein LOC108749558 [Trachymyrmex septentrionalis]|uniref:uncharacterized protein LOC108749558 n=1 Tax=Trachymyrmex septentrionalis TaxID=34720 RepID=UPI00084F7F51|nr:PREDICTED: uncharacterized protein LOC108749558 [Trachymyrmex septentrionalis]
MADRWWLAPPSGGRFKRETIADDFGNCLTENTKMIEILNFSQTQLLQNNVLIWLITLLAELMLLHFSGRKALKLTKQKIPLISKEARHFRKNEIREWSGW